MRNHLKSLSPSPLFVVSALSLFLLFFIIFQFYLNRLGAFGCFDDCNNFMRGYFFLEGKTMFSEIFSGHMPGMSYISALIQKVTTPSSIYYLLLYHTLFLFGVFLVSSIILIVRFKWAALLFVIFYESYKLYFFGDRFLAEGVIIYPIVYVAALVWSKFNKGKIYKWEYILTGVIAWFVTYMREPYIPLILFLYFLVLWGKTEIKPKAASLAIFVILTVSFFVIHPVNDFILNVYTMNKINIASELSQTGTEGIGILKAFVYPFLVFTTKEWNTMWITVSAFSGLFLFFSALLLRKNKILVFLIVLILGLSAIRYVEPGKIFYESYHILVWFGLLVMFVALMLVFTKNKKIKKIALLLLAGIFILTFINPQNVLLQRVNTVEEVNQGYANYSINGRVIKILANPNSTLFVDGSEDLIYWRADLKPAYKYSWYTSLMPFYKPFVDAREEMFRKYPPDFYYGNCRKGYFLPDFIKDDYANFLKNSKKSCLYIKKDQIPGVSDEAWDEARSLGFVLE